MKKNGAQWISDRCDFTVWAPLKEKMILQLIYPEKRNIAMVKDEEGYFHATVENLFPGARYYFRPDDKQNFPDPVSNYQPEGVHGPSEVVNHGNFKWTDDTWNPPPVGELIFYELHVGTFTEAGTFEAIIDRLDDLTDIGINAIELMPVNQFPGDRNWGYDGVFPYAVQHSYGGPDALKKLVNACHEKSIAVFLDVVYNHLGPEGNYLHEFAPYFTGKYKTPWGEAINFDDDWCDGVREYFADNAVYWMQQYHIDGLRCDAVHMLYDQSAVHIWEYISNSVEEFKQTTGRTHYLIAESDLNSPKVVRNVNEGGWGFDAQWLDDFHHALYTVLDKKGVERYEDFGALNQLAKAYRDGFVFSGEWVKFRKRKFGVSSTGVPGDKFLVFNQNHDQVGNRVQGERLSILVDEDRLKLAAAAVILSPYIPMLFMGEEYGEVAPFYYFVSHSDEQLITAVREGRKKEFACLGFSVDPPDPFDRKTFEACKLNWSVRTNGKHYAMLQWHKRLVHLRKTHEAFHSCGKKDLDVYVKGEDAIILHRRCKSGRDVICVFNFADNEVTVDLPKANETWKLLLCSNSFLRDDINSRSVLIPPLTFAAYEHSHS